MLNEVILVIGGAGYIGSHVNKLLNKRGYNTVVVDNLVSGHKHFVKWGKFIEGDLSNKSQIRTIFQNYNIVGVMHFAAFSSTAKSVSEPQEYYINNVINTINLLEVMKEYSVNYFIFSSSAAIYGVPQILPIIESHPPNPINPYGKTKWIIENILQDYSKAYNFQYVSLRYFNAAGADPERQIGELHSPETHLIPIILDVAAGKQETIHIYGNDYDTKDGTCIRDYIHVNDLAQAHILSLEYLFKTKKSEIFNLGNGNGFSVKTIIDVAQKITLKKINKKIVFRREGDPSVLVGSSDKIKKLLNWIPQYNSLERIIETAWHWHQLNI